MNINTKIIILIIVTGILYIVGSSILTVYFIHNNVSAMIIIATIYLKIFLSMSNLILLYLNPRNYYNLIRPLFFIPQIIISLLVLLFEEYDVITIYNVILPYFVVQFFFYLNIKNSFEKQKKLSNS